MTKLLERAIAEIQKLPPEVQDAIASRLLEDLADEMWWEEQFASTSDEEWDRMVKEVKAEIARGATIDLDTFLREIG